jgi:hypothetical protein
MIHHALKEFVVLFEEHIIFDIPLQQTAKSGEEYNPE